MEIAIIILSVIGLIVNYIIINPKSEKFIHLFINTVSFTALLGINIAYLTGDLIASSTWNRPIFLFIAILLNIQQYVIYKSEKL